MPIFFNLESHLWIAYLCFANGFLLTWGLTRVSQNYKSQLNSPEWWVLSSFFISILCNWILIVTASSVGVAFSKLVYPICLLTTIGLFVCFKTMSFKLTWLRPRYVLYIAVFSMLFINGGLIEQVADSWWHLALAKKIAWFNTPFIERGHLIEYVYREYPKLWHSNLALISELSGSSLPVIWNSITAWIAVIKVMAVYVMAFALSQRRQVSLIAAILFVFLPGVGVSYLRVSAWPSHIAYAALFCAIALSAKLLNKLVREKVQTFTKLIKLSLRLRSTIASIALLCLVIFLSHKVELVWLFIAIIFLSLSFLVSTRSKDNFLENLAKIGLGLLFLTALWFFINEAVKGFASIDLMLAYALPILALISLMPMFSENQKTRLKGGVLILSLMVLSIDYQHLLSLVLPEFELKNSGIFEKPLRATGWFGGHLLLPAWHLQLRDGWLYSGLLSMPVSFFLWWRKKDVLAAFCAITMITLFWVVSSPYLYQWLTQVMNYHSSWRISVLSVHFLIWANFMVYLWAMIKNFSSPIKAIALTLPLIFLIWDSRQHFDSDLIALKREHRSAQRNWNLFYGQNYVYYDSSLRYEAEMQALSKIIEPESVIFSDLPSSYYLAAYLPIYIRNAHAHQGGIYKSRWANFIRERSFCYLDQVQNIEKVKRFYQDLANKQNKNYIALNKDEFNRNLRYGCIWNRKQFIESQLSQLGVRVFDGKIFQVYELNGGLSPTASGGH